MKEKAYKATFREINSVENYKKKGIEGGTWRRPEYRKFIYRLALILQPKNFLEIGFNTGSGTATVFDASPKTRFYAFDICKKDYVKRALEVLEEEGCKIAFYEGDSTKKLPEFIEENPEQKFDFIIVDGSHFGDVPFKDLQNSCKVINKNGIILVDDLDNIEVKESVNRFRKMHGKEFLCLNESNISKIDFSSDWEDSFRLTVEKISEAWPGKSDKRFYLFVKR